MMQGFLEALVENPLLQSALIAGLASSVVSGIIGSYVVVKRIVFISGSIAHSVLGGIGVALWLKRNHEILWINPIHGALVAALLSSWIIGWIHLHYRQREDAVIAALWSVGMAVGLIFISLTPGYNVELTNFLVGNLLWVSHSDLWTLGSLDALIVVITLLFHKRFLAVCFDEEQSRLQGQSVPGLYLLLLSLTAITVVLLVQVVGIILVITMLTIPPTIANLFTGRLSRMMFIAILVSAIFCFAGTALAYELDFPPGATIALLAGVSYVLVLFTNRRR